MNEDLSECVNSCGAGARARSAADGPSRIVEFDGVVEVPRNAVVAGYDEVDFFAANAGVALTFVIFFIVLKENRYAASTIRVEAGQPVISSGVYSIVSHPMYSGALLLLVLAPLALGSFWTMLIIVPLFPVLIWRLLDEEHFLKQNLPGYVDYCRTTRFRLIPRIW